MTAKTERAVDEDAAAFVGRSIRRSFQRRGQQCNDFRQHDGYVLWLGAHLDPSTPALRQAQGAYFAQLPPFDKLRAHICSVVARVEGFQPEIRGESYLAPGKLRQGVEPAG